MSAALNEPALTIDHHRGVYVVPAEDPAPGDLRERLDRLARTRLEGTCREAAEAVLDEADPAVWMIRDLEVELALGADLIAGGGDDEGLLARAWGGEIVDAVAAAVAGGPDGRGVVRFTDRADQLASFVVEQARGRARDQWYWTDFDGLGNLPVGAAIRQALVREPQLTWQALILVADAGALEELLGAVDDAGAAAILRSLDAGDGAVGSATPQSDSIEALLAPLQGIRAAAGLGALAGAKGALRLVAAAQRQQPAIAHDRWLVGAARHLAAFVSGLQEQHDARARIWQALLAGEPAEAMTAVAGLAGPTEWLDSVSWVVEALTGERELAARLAAAAGEDTAVGAPARSAALRTPYGGAFLLLSSLIAAGATGSAALRAAVCGKCLGGTQAASADAAFRLAVGLDGEPAPDDEHPLDLLRSCLEQLSQAGRLDGRVLVPAVVPATSERSETLVLRDVRRDAWVHAAAAGGDSALAEGVAFARNATGLRFGIVLDGGADAPPAVQPALATHAARAKPVPSELEHLCSPAALSPERDLALSAVSHDVLREFAGRLPGFEWSSGAYLLENFLAGDDLVRRGRDEIEVVLGPRPLAVILRLAGVDGRTFEAPWLEAAVTLRVEGC